MNPRLCLFATATFVTFFVTLGAESLRGERLSLDEWPGIERALQQGQVLSADRLLAILPVSLRARFFLVFKTKSPFQPASFLNPRIALWNRDRSRELSFGSQ